MGEKPDVFTVSKLAPLSSMSSHSCTEWQAAVASALPFASLTVQQSAPRRTNQLIAATELANKASAKPRGGGAGGGGEKRG